MSRSSIATNGAAVPFLRAVKILGKLLLRSFLGPFLAVFFVVLFVLILQFLWKYADDLIGKGLEWYIIAELLFYASASLVPLALPLAILLSSIMTFGSLGEFNELTAIKSAGISLQRFMRPLIAVVAVLSVGAFFFSNTVMPVANLSFQTLLYDVRESKPALALKEGVFYNGLQGYSIKIGDKDAENRMLKDVLIYDHTQGLGNVVVVSAKRGEMLKSADERYLIFKLMDGERYEEITNQNVEKRSHVRFAFTQQDLAFDLAGFKLRRTETETYKDHYAMLNIAQLGTAIDSINFRKDKRTREIDSFLKPFLPVVNMGKTTVVATANDEKRLDSLLALPRTKPNILETAMNNARGAKGYIGMLQGEVGYQDDLLVRHEIERNRKYTLSVACLILFFIGAPLGAIIRKGGIGMPLVVAIGLFLIYHVLSISAEKVAREQVVSPAEGMWFSSFILFPLGVYLTYKATRDSQLFNAGSYGAVFQRLLGLFRRTKVSQTPVIR